MQEQLRDLMFYTAGMFGKRYSKRQKKRFEAYIRSIANKVSLDFAVKSGKNGRCRNLVVGNLEKAKLVIGCSYDTPTRAILPDNSFYPFNAEKNYKKEMLEFATRILLAVALLGGYLLLINALSLSMSNPAWIPLHILIVFIAFKLILGLENKYNFRRDSASLAMVLDLMDKNTKNKLAYIFFDRSVNSYEGFGNLSEEDRQLIDKKIVIHIGSMGKGGVLCLAADKPDSFVRGHRFVMPGKGITGIEVAEVNLSESNAANSPILYAKKGMYIVQADQMEGGEPVIRGTRCNRDSNVDFEQLSEIENAINHNIELMIK